MIINTLEINGENTEFFDKIIENANPTDKLIYYIVKHTINENEWKNKVNSLLFQLRNASRFLETEFEIQFDYNSKRFIPLVTIYLPGEEKRVLSRCEAPLVN